MYNGEGFMSDEDAKKIMMEANTDDFNTMRHMLSTIEMKIMQLDPMKQRSFYKPLQNFIYEAWSDACDSENEFLFKGDTGNVG